jgi:2-polyprenyl-3-methyl-5-hydroxy-6-metoxy-1,4-benzoquinol methylase
MKELNSINTYLGGHAISVAGVKKILRGRNLLTGIIICEIGCGGGDNLKAIDRWCAKNNITASFIGIDLKDECIEFAKQQYPDLHARWICSDYQLAEFQYGQPTIIFSSLFCHHFSDGELLVMLQWMKNNAQGGFFINEIHRHPLAYYSIKMITAICSGSYLVKNDAPISVTRAFKKNEWKALFQKAGISNYTIEWKWAFRHLITYCNG